MNKSNTRKDSEIRNIIEILGTSPRLLVASDFDGTVSGLKENYHESKINPLAKIALRKLSEAPNTFVAVISGRSLRDLSPRLAGLDRVRMVGSHGHEFDLDSVSQLSEDQIRALKKSILLIQSAVKRNKGASMETKPHGAVFHYRGCRKISQSELNKIKRELEKTGVGIVREGNKVIEYCAVTTNKGDALIKIREQVSPTSTLFIGDDVTDEAAFKVLGPAEISVKVGGGDTSARFRVNSVDEAEKFLARLAERREEWLRTTVHQEIDNHLFLADLRTSALIDGDGVVNWLCAPRLDSAPLFGSLVGGPAAGHFSIKGQGRGKLSYSGNTLIGKTKFKNVSVTDFLDCSTSRSYQRAGRSDFVRIIEGSGPVQIEFAPKFNFGRVPTRLSGISNGLRIDCGQQQMVLISPKCKWKISREGMHDVARCTLNLKKEKIPLKLLIGTGSDNHLLRSYDSMLKETAQFWQGWHGTLNLPSTAKALVSRSALVLRGLCYGPTGAIAAAATTSLPETIGGVRNWDYRFCWPRDASMSAGALLRIGAPGPAIRLLDWILELVLDDENAGFLAPLYSVTGRAVNGEAEVSEAIGYRGSRPVRIGNLASEQLQLDILGPVAELMLKLTQHGASLTSEHLQLSEFLVKLIESRWNDPDSGIWEIRGAQRHYVHSKLMCWYTIYCCIQVSEYLGVVRKDWRKLLKEIRSQIEQKGFNKQLGSYVAAYDLSEADAALIWVVLSGFHPPDHVRSKGTLRYIENTLYRSGAVYRYIFDDTLSGGEGEFVICRSWLIEAFAMCGQKAKAKALFDEMLRRIGPLGLLSEQWDPANSIALGNYPQAYSHLGLINAACALEGR